MDVINVFFMIFQNSLVDNHIVYTLMSEPVKMAVDECVRMANEINNNADIPQVAMCMPEIIKGGLPV